jgi:hypothetical protein
VKRAEIGRKRMVACKRVFLLKVLVRAVRGREQWLVGMSKTAAKLRGIAMERMGDEDGKGGEGRRAMCSTERERITLISRQRLH